MVVSTIYPDPLNRNGPSGLIWELIEEIRQTCEISVEFIAPKSGFSGIVNKLGLFIKRGSRVWNSSDLILVYPFTSLRYVRRSEWHQVVVIGPDSASFLYARFCRIANGISKLRYAILAYWFHRLEHLLLEECASYVVVGINDRRWIKWVNTRVSERREKVVYLQHPLLSHSLIAISDDALSQTQSRVGTEPIRLIFCGDLSVKYCGDMIATLSRCMRSNNFFSSVASILVVGKKNAWVKTVFQREGATNVAYIDWVDDYRSLCSFADIHCFPLLAGAGTKNRALTATANGVTVVSTPIGLENILNLAPKGKIYIGRTPRQFVEAIRNALSNHLQVEHINLNKGVTGVRNFRSTVTARFKEDVNRLLRLDIR